VSGDQVIRLSGKVLADKRLAALRDILEASMLAETRSNRGNK